MQIIAGTLRGRKLRTLTGSVTRPTSGRVRGALFNILGPGLAGGAFLDLFAGSGACAIEALSRGAGSAVAVESSKVALPIIQENRRTLGLDSRLQIQQGDVMALLPRLAGPFRAIFADPPYGTAIGLATLQWIGEHIALLEDTGAFILEHGEADPVPPEAARLRLVRQYPHGGTVLSLYRVR